MAQRPERGKNVGGAFSCRHGNPLPLGRWRTTRLMGDSVLGGRRPSGATLGLDDDGLGLRGVGGPGRRGSAPEAVELGLEEEGEGLPEEGLGEEFLESPTAQEALSELERVLEPDSDSDVPEVSRLSITRESPSPRPRGRKSRRKRTSDLARPKANWQALKDRVGCFGGHAWISPRRTALRFCLYWPSVYWTERFLEDTTLSITVPAVSPRVEELSRPKRFYSEYYNNNRTTPIWPIPRATLEHRPSSRLKQLATPRVRNNIWSINMSEVSHVSRAAQMAVPSPRILRLSKPRIPAPLLEEWDPMPKPKPHVSDYNRLLHLAAPKLLSDKCVPDRDPRWEVLDATKKAVASPRVLALARPKLRKEFNEGYDPYRISPAALGAQASPRLYELATPKSITKKV
ncbi:sperm microtubule associated protein 2 [Dasypus novemcinctus]|uniref:sperm microtubule associated protein 2 n=1 Tax=Dasypus novemcinctus TaxID=9361 RepID=UPI002660152D|nr:testicular haploid expressed gene protein [Dasypus novemcinctus]